MELNREISEELRKDVTELLEHMDKIPLLRYEVLVLFHNFKEGYKDMVHSAMREEVGE
jgi:hypothetical protein